MSPAEMAVRIAEMYQSMLSEKRIDQVRHEIRYSPLLSKFGQGSVWAALLRLTDEAPPPPVEEETEEE